MAVNIGVLYAPIKWTIQNYLGVLVIPATPEAPATIGGDGVKLLGQIVGHAGGGIIISSNFFNRRRSATWPIGNLAKLDAAGAVVNKSGGGSMQYIVGLSLGVKLITKTPCCGVGKVHRAEVRVKYLQIAATER